MPANSWSGGERGETTSNSTRRPPQVPRGESPGPPDGLLAEICKRVEGRSSTEEF